MSDVASSIRIMQITWASLTSGLVGSALGALLTFTAAVLIFWRTKVGDRARDKLRDEEAEQRRRADAVARLLAALDALRTEVRWAPLLQGKARGRLLEALVTFFLSSKRDHPSVTTWMSTEYTAIDVLMTRWRRVWWVPVIGTRRATAVGTRLTQTIAAIGFWAMGDRDDVWFDRANR